MRDMQNPHHDSNNDDNDDSNSNNPGLQNDEVITLAVPTEQLDFVRRNPEIAEHISNLFTMMKEHERAIQIINNLFTCPELFAPLLQNGTEQELIDLLETVIQQSDKAEILKVNSEDFKDLMNQMGDKAVFTPANSPRKPKS